MRRARDRNPPSTEQPAGVNGAPCLRHCNGARSPAFEQATAHPRCAAVLSDRYANTAALPPTSHSPADWPIGSPTAVITPGGSGMDDGAAGTARGRGDLRQPHLLRRLRRSATPAGREETSPGPETESAKRRSRQRHLDHQVRTSTTDFDLTAERCRHRRRRETSPPPPTPRPITPCPPRWRDRTDPATGGLGLGPDGDDTGFRAERQPLTDTDTNGHTTTSGHDRLGPHHADVAAGRATNGQPNTAYPTSAGPGGHRAVVRDNRPPR